MNELDLTGYNLIELTGEDLISLCHLNNFKPNELDDLDLSSNSLNNLDFITENTIFVNLKILSLSFNDMKDINNVKYLTNLTYLGISGLNLDNEKEIIEILKTMSKLKDLTCFKTFKNYTKEKLKKELSNIKSISV